MRKTLAIVLLLLLASLGSAQKVWTVSSVPNTRLESNLIHVSDPDDILSDSCEIKINTALSAIRDQVDVFVVALNSIGDADIDVFANELFNFWGIGDRDLNNGVLLLLAKEQHDFKFETGYGVEETLPDALCQRIFEEAMVPFFKEDDYESGLVSGVTQILQVYGGEIPDGLVTLLPVSQEEEEDDLSGMDALAILFAAGLLFFLPILAFGVYISRDRYVKPVSALVDSGKVLNGVRVIDDTGKKWDGNPWGGVGCLKALMYGLSPYLFLFIGFFLEQMRVGNENEIHYGLGILYGLVLYLTWICMRQNGRALRAANKLARASLNPKAVYETACRETLNRFTRWMAFWVGWAYYLAFKHKINHSLDNQCIDCGDSVSPYAFYNFSPVQQKEIEMKTVEYSPFICGAGHVTLLRKVKNHQYRECEVCHGITEHVINTKVLEEATYDKAGLKEVTYHCVYCDRNRVAQEMVPKLYRALSGSTSGGYHSSSSSRSYHSSSHRSGGSFGGGRSGGGGYHGKW